MSDSGEESDDQEKNIFRRLPQRMRDEAIARAARATSGEAPIGVPAGYVLPPGINFTPVPKANFQIEESDDVVKPSAAKPAEKKKPQKKKVSSSDDDDDGDQNITCLRPLSGKSGHGSLGLVSASDSAASSASASTSGPPPSPPPEDVNTLKQKGGAAFKSGKYSEASVFYSKAINLIIPKSGPHTNASSGDECKMTSVLLCNRSICYRRMGRLEDALGDAVRAVERDSQAVKPRYLQAVAEKELGWYKAALSSAKDGLKVKVDDSLNKIVDECLTALSESEDEERRIQARLSAAQTSADFTQEARCCAELAELEGKLGDFEAAVRWSLQYLGLAQRTAADRAAEADALKQMQRWYDKLGYVEDYNRVTNDLVTLAIAESRRNLPLNTL